jgi:prolyl-tRNA synthetase
MVSADSGAMGGSTSAEFQVLTQSGEDIIAVSDGDEYAANLEVAAAYDPRLDPPAREEARPIEKAHTPGHGSIDDIARFFKADKTRFLKSLLYKTKEGAAALAVVRGDHEVNEVKLARALGTREVFLASEADVARETGARVGFAGPVKFAGRVVVDRDASLVQNGITGANETDHHLVNVAYGRDFEGEVADIRSVVEGDRAPSGAGKLKIYRGIEAGHIFILGTHYTAQMGANYLAEDGASKSIVMGCYGIGVSRLVATAIEQHHDEDGIRWPAPIAPYQVHLVTIGQGAELVAAAEKLVGELEARGVEVLWDDRDERPGVKFKDADLVGLPFRITLGDKGLKAGVVELKPRSQRDPKAFESLPIAGAAEALAARVREALGQ